MKLRQSSAFVWMIFILFIIIFGFAYSILMKPTSVLYNKFYNDSDLTDQTYQTFFTRSQTIWIWFPLAAVFSMIIWSIIKMQERDEFIQ